MTALMRALGAKRDELNKDQRGFTLVELLVVVIIIGILAAIAIPVFLSQRESAWAGSVESDIKNAQIAISTIATQDNGDYTTASGTYDGSLTPPTSILDADGDVLLTPTEDVKLVVVGTTTSYTITGTHASLAGKTWTFDSATGKLVKP